MKELTEQNLRDIATGACIRGSGGGGPIAMIDPLIKEILKYDPVKLVDPDEVPDDEWVGASAGAGSPAEANAAAGTVPKLADSAAEAFTHLREYQKRRFKGTRNVTHVVSAETGIAGTLLPLFVGAKLGIPVVDGSGARRALPSLTMCSYAAEPISPVEIVSKTKELVSINVKDTKAAEQPMMAIVTTEDFAHMGGLAFWPMSAETGRNRIIAKAVSEVEDLGKSLRDARNAGQDPVVAVENALNGQVIFRGKLQRHKDETVGSFDFLVVPFKDKTGTTLTIYGQNESMIAWQSDLTHPVAMGPDLICYLTTDGVPFTNAELNDFRHPKTEIAVIAAACDEKLCEPAIVQAFLEALRPLGYAGTYRKFDGRQGPPVAPVGRQPGKGAPGFQPAANWWSRRLRPDS